MVSAMTTKNLEKRILSAMRKLRREYGSECVFSFKTIHDRVGGDEEELRSAIEYLVRLGEVFSLGDCYRLS